MGGGLRVQHVQRAQDDVFLTDEEVDWDLVRVLEDWSVPPLTLHAIYPHSRHLAAKVRAFVDFTVNHGDARIDKKRSLAHKARHRR